MLGDVESIILHMYLFWMGTKDVSRCFFAPDHGLLSLNRPIGKEIPRQLVTRCFVRIPGDIAGIYS